MKLARRSHEEKGLHIQRASDVKHAPNHEKRSLDCEHHASQETTKEMHARRLITKTKRAHRHMTKHKHTRTRAHKGKRPGQ